MFWHVHCRNISTIKNVIFSIDRYHLSRTKMYINPKPSYFPQNFTYLQITRTMRTHLVVLITQHGTGI